MKPTLLSIILCFTAITTFAEVTLRGIITYQNTGEKMKTLQVTARGASPTLVKASTNTEGVFVLVFPNGKVGDLVTVELGTPIYDVVNDPRELNVTLTDNPNYKIRLVVCKKGERDANAISYYNISTKYLETNYQKQAKKKDTDIANLKKQLTQNGANADALNKQIYDLYAEKAKLDNELEAQKKNAYKMAEDFSRIDLAQADAIYRKAFETFKQGDIEGARQVLNSTEAKQQEADLKKLEADILKSESNVHKVKDSLSVAEQKITNAKGQRDTLKASVIKKKFLDGQLAELQNKYDEAEQLYTEGADLDNTNVDNLWTLADFVYKQNKVQKAIVYYEKVLALSIPEDLAGMLYMNLGAAYLSLNKIPESEKYYQQSLDIYERLSKSYPQGFDTELATILECLAIFNQNQNNMSKSEKYFLQSLGIYERLSKDNPQVFEPNLARISMNLGNFYQVLNKVIESEKYYLQSLNIYERLAKNDPQQFEPKIALTTGNLAGFYQALNMISESEKYHLQSLNIYERLAKSNPQRFEPDLSITAMNLGTFYLTINKVSESEKYYLQSLSISERLSKSSPEQFDSNLADAAMNLGILYQKLDKMSESEKCYLKSLKIYERLSKYNPERFEPDLAKTAVNLGSLYITINKISESEKYYMQSLDIRIRLSKSNPEQYELDLATSLNDFGVFYEKTKQLDKAQNMYSRALALLQGTLQNGQLHFLEEYNRVFNNLGILRDSLVVQKNYAKVVEIQAERAKSREVLRGILTAGSSNAASEYGTLAWYQFFAKQYLAAEQSAKHALELDVHQISFEMYIAYALLFQNKEIEAHKRYYGLKNLKDENGNSLRSLVISHLTSFELSDLDKKQIEKIWQWVME